MEKPDKQLHDSKSTIPFFFEVCSKLEGLCAELYHYYSTIHQDNENVSQVWTKTALEEENHQKQFELANRLSDDIDFELKVDLEKANRICNKLYNLLEHVRQNPPDIVTALTKAIEMEESLADLHMDSSVNINDESVRKMFQALRDCDQEHLKSLRHCLAVVTLSTTEMAG